MLPACITFIIGKAFSSTNLIGVTGGICCGKSTLNTMIKRRLGWPIIDCDKIAEEIRMPG